MFRRNDKFNKNSHYFRPFSVWLKPHLVALSFEHSMTSNLCLNRKPITDPFVFHFSCVTFYMNSLILAMQTSPKTFPKCIPNRTGKEKTTGLNNINVKYLRRLSCSLKEKKTHFIALMHNSASSMRLIDAHVCLLKCKR